MSGIVFKNARILDGSGQDPVTGSVLVKDGRIAAVGDVKAADSAGATVIECGGKTLMPGLIEAHGHPTFGDTSTLEALGEIPPEEHTLLALRNARKMINQGFTSLCSAAAAKPRLDVVLRNAINDGDFPGPRMLAASPEMTVTGGLGDVRLAHMHRETFAIVCDGADEFRRTAREMVREGVDTLKINPSGDEFVPVARAHQTVMNEAEIAAVCEVAQSRDKRVAAHCRSAESVKLCLKHGVELIYHATLCDDEALQMLADAKDRVFVVPTIGVTITTLYEAAPWGVTEEVATGLGLKYELGRAIESMKALKKLGLRILPGGDYGFAWNPIGNNARDLQHFVERLDFTPMEAIVSATRLGGEIMMRGDELGMIKPGYVADILLVDGDPLQDIAMLQDAEKLVGIMKDGAFHKAPA